MKNVLTYLSATTMLTLAVAAFADDTGKDESKVKYKDNGGYESTQSSEHTAPNGTTTSSKTNVDVKVDSNGKVDKKVKSENVTDPKGLMNEKKDTATTEIKQKDNGGYKQTVTRTHKDAAGTNASEKSVTNVDVDKEGNTTQTTDMKKTVDPKGLMNEKKTRSHTKVVNGQVVDQNTESN